LAPTSAHPDRRLVSLDVFRGIAIAAMILVNNPGTWRPVYAPLQHADWNGWTLTDLIFPFFLFIVGVAITLSFAAQSSQKASTKALFFKVLRRTCIIFALGIIINGFPDFDWSEIRVPGVLQRIAVCYFLASVVALTAGVRGQALTTAILILGYWAAMKLVPLPGHKAGLLKPGRNLAAYIDTALLHGHLLHRRWDPEGILSTFPATATTLAGVLTGHWLRVSKTPFTRLSGLFVAGNVCIIAGLVMNVWFPINKNLWTSSYVVFTAGMALNFLGMCYWLVDVRGYRLWATPFVMYGTNAILAYMLSTLIAKVMILWTVEGPDGSAISLRRYLVDRFLLPVASPINASLLYAIGYVLLWLAVMAVLYRRRIFFKI
jgi:predicted acyltransferase